MEEEKNTRAIRSILLIQRFDPFLDLLQKRFITGHSFLGLVAKIAEEREAKVVVPVGEVMDLQRF